MSVKKWYEERHGSAKGYYIMVMEASVLSCLLVSAASNFAPGLYALNVLPAAGLGFSLYSFGKEYRKEFALHATVFVGLFLFALYAPWLMKALSARLSQDPLSAARETAVGIIAVLLAFTVLRTFLRKKTVEGKVVMADKDNAVVRIDYDIFAGVRAGDYVVKNNGAKKGDTVTVELETSFIKGVKPSRIRMIEKKEARKRKARKRAKKKGLVSIDAIAAIVLMLMILVIVQNYASGMNKQAKDYGTAIQAKAASIGMGSRMNALKALGLGAADYYNARSKAPVISVSPTEYQEAKISKNKGENDVHTVFGEHEFTYPAPLDYYYYNGCIASNPAVLQSACKTSLPQCTVKFRHCGTKYFELGDTLSYDVTGDGELDSLILESKSNPPKPPYDYMVSDRDINNYFVPLSYSTPDTHVTIFKGTGPYANTVSINYPIGYGPTYAQAYCGGEYYCYPLYRIGGDCDIRPEPNLNYYPEREVCE